ncbi:jg16519 [Pararge aegeria aegeria]|uniref:Jg16519 protein n=1 Tax=Pararge aegeria aegeria TaxID=348720 RepID=A0A8S4SKB1_9NEOP|nr:jg16519 [Pararge aegeria aegeria]
MTYGTETCSLTMGLIRILRVTQWAIERAMPGVRNQIKNVEIRRRTRVSSASREAEVSMSGAHSLENR